VEEVINTESQVVADKLFDAGESAPKEAAPAAKTEEVAPKEKVESQEPVKLELNSDTLSKEEASALLGFAEKHKLDQEALNTLAKEFTDKIGLRQSEQVKAHEKTVEQWRKDAELDPHIGGKDFEKNVNLAKTAVKKFGSEGLIRLIDESGYGNHPEVIRLFAKIGGELTSDQMVRGKPGLSQMSLEEKFYGKG